jgi:hypothetical protein
MKKSLIIIALLIVELGFAQLTIKKSSIDSGGATTSSGNTTMIYTIGETVVQENTQGNIHISEGFISPDLQGSLAISNYSTLAGITIFPNPATDYINLAFATDADYSIQIYDINGKSLASFQTMEDIRINLSNYSAGNYILLIKDKAKKLYQSYKIIKK